MSEVNDNQDNGLEWSLYQNGSVSLYHRPDVLRTDIQSLADRGYVVHQFTASGWQAESDFHDALDSVFGFPEYAYEGRNINAFNDRLCRVEIPSRCALVFWRYERFAVREPKFSQWVLDVFQKHSRWQMFWGKRLLTMLQSDDVSLRFDPIGACAVGWARSEAGYPDKKRWSEGGRR